MPAGKHVASTAGRGGVTGQTAAVAAGTALAAICITRRLPIRDFLSLHLRSARAAKVGSTFEMVVNLNGGHDVFSVPMQFQYDQRS